MPQIAHFRQASRVVAVDLRGPRRQRRPEAGIHLAGFAGTMSLASGQLGLQKANRDRQKLRRRESWIELAGVIRNSPQAGDIDSIVMAPAGLRDSPDCNGC